MHEKKKFNWLFALFSFVVLISLPILVNAEAVVLPDANSFTVPDSFLDEQEGLITSLADFEWPDLSTMLSDLSAIIESNPIIEPLFPELISVSKSVLFSEKAIEKHVNQQNVFCLGKCENIPKNIK